MTEAVMDDYERLPCGCLMGSEPVPNDLPRFVFVPHSLDCQYYRYALAECERQGKPITIVDTR